MIGLQNFQIKGNTKEESVFKNYEAQRDTMLDEER